MIKDMTKFEKRILLNIISSKSHVLNKLDLKFISSFKGRNLNDNSTLFIDELIDKRIYTNESNYNSYTEIELDQYYNLNNFIFGENFYYKKNIYSVNFEIFEEIFLTIDYIINQDRFYSFSEDIDNLILGIKGCHNDNEKLDFLKSKHKSFWKIEENQSEFLLFMENESSNNSWKELVLDYYIDDNFLLYYLSAETHEPLRKSRFYKTHFKQWIKFHRLKKLILFCKKNIEFIEGKEKNKTSLNLSEKIFKDNGLDIFNFIVSNYTDLKNKAFFSYLFHFFSDNNLLQEHKAKSSVHYNEFLIKNKYLENFSKVIQRTDNKSNREEKAFEIFKNLYQDFIQNNLK